MTESPEDSSASRLGLGTVQFGIDYGITNANGQVAEREAAAILALADDVGIETLDTAHAYGESEQVIGRCWPAGAKFQVVTKTPAFCGDGTNARRAGDRLRRAFSGSLDALRQSRVYALLVHDAKDLLGPVGDALWSEMQELKAAGKVTKLGVSAYEPDEVDRILDGFPIDLIQIPFNAVDRRLVGGGQLERLDRADVEVHARSLFLQGLLLSCPADLPDRFAPLAGAVRALDLAFATRGVSRLEGLLASAFARPEIDRLVVGVTSADELTAIAAAAEVALNVPAMDVDLPLIDPRYLNPSNWAELGQKR